MHSRLLYFPFVSRCWNQIKSKSKFVFQSEIYDFVNKWVHIVKFFSFQIFISKSMTIQYSIEKIKEDPYYQAQIREQMSDPEISWYGKSILGCGLWLGLDRGKKGSGPILSNFFGCFFQFFMGKKKIENIIASALKSCIEKR